MDRLRIEVGIKGNCELLSSSEEAAHRLLVLSRLLVFLIDSIS